jgi:hypothetical protein
VAVGHAIVTRYVSEALVTRSVSEEDRDAGRADERWGVYGSSLVDTSGYHWLVNAARYQYCAVAVGHPMVTRYVSEDLVTRSVSEVDRDAGRG